MLWRSLLRVFLIVLTGLILLKYLGVVAMHIPSTPSHTFVLLLASPNTPPVGTYLLASESKLWFDATVVSGIAGVVLGLCLRLFRFWRAAEMYCALVLLSGILVLIHGIAELASWFGVVLFVFCLYGGLRAFVHPQERAPE